ncbi:hypothetical protein F2P56_019511 [Juglans regia]|uniref:Transposase-associated domain-containing protein n=2 Tax=Juglans regia TaxID=51240 RepID=A0A833UAH3_JUGRE|nr:uncharacterized protein LOC109012928 [Juglans regia]KAF5459572.1 hypothetical protein F2P56_019511 [Juglans regia]
MDKSWMNSKDRLRSTEYAEGVKEFLTQARNHAVGSDHIRCPCRICSNNIWLPISEVETHLFLTGINPNYTEWIFHGEEEAWNVTDDEEDGHVSDEEGYIDDMDEMLNDIRGGTFADVALGSPSCDTGAPIPGSTQYSAHEKLLNDAKQPLFDGCTQFSQLSFIVKLLHIKTIGGWSIRSFDMLLELLRSAFPDALLPQSYEESRSLQRGLGFSYTKIHACPNDCILYWKQHSELTECPKCKTSRWLSTTHKSRLIPQKVLRHFPLKPRLQRLYMSRKTAVDMRWHKEQRANDGINMRHPADSEVWNQFDKDHNWFAADACNVRLGLSSDGFNPFNNMAKPYSIWPVILVPYNLPPWLCMKEAFFITSLIIPGPKSPGNEIDVYLQPLIDELNDLWTNGVATYDASAMETLLLHAALLWIINDFPTYGNLSGWSTKGKLACPTCNLGTDSMWLTYGRKHAYMGHRRFLPANHIWRTKKSVFNGKCDHHTSPNLLTGLDIINQLSFIGDVHFGKGLKKRKRNPNELNWTKRSIFFNLPYWSTLKLRHNLDVMHIEKNICDNILGTFMNIPGKTKDNINSRRTLSNLGIRNELHLIQDGQRCTMPHACFTLYGDERKSFCEWLSAVKFPDGFAANVSRCVSTHDCKISGFKSQDCHVFIQRLLPVAVGGYLKNDVSMALIELSNFFKELCARTLDVNLLTQLESDIVVILCKLEMIFPPSFFDVMVHLAVHLPREALLAGPVQYRWMYPFERYLDRNVDRLDDDEADGFSIFTQKVRPLGMSTRLQLDDKLFKSASWYILNNCTEIAPYIDEHDNHCKLNYPHSVDRTHEKQFPRWLKERVQDQRAVNPSDISADLYAIACGPDPWVASYVGCIVNGKRFHTKALEELRRTQNSGVFVTGEHQSNSLDFYGSIDDVLELHYMGWRHVYLFKCQWYDVGDRRRGIRVDNHMCNVNMNWTWYKDEPFVLACQASQCFYIKDTRVKGNWYVVQKFIDRNVYDIPTGAPVEDHDAEARDSTEAYKEDESFNIYTTVECGEALLLAPLHRSDLEPSPIDNSTNIAEINHASPLGDFINDAEMETESEDGDESHDETNNEDVSTDEDIPSD